MRPEFNVALIIPTGIGARIGGFGGDAMTLLPLLASICDTVVTHPNVANAACFQTLPSNTFYVEGYALDRFFAGDWLLSPVWQNKLGIIWDAGMCPKMRILHENTLAAVETVYGVHIIGAQTTDEPVALDCVVSKESGRSTGMVRNPHVLLRAAQALQQRGATAIAVCCVLPEPMESEANQAYRTQGAVDPIGGIEAMISHYLVAKLGIPVAHVPVFSYEDALPIVDKHVDPRAASEFIVSTFMPCVLTGLSKAPQYVSVQSANANGLSIHQLTAVIVPIDALGSLPVLSALENGTAVLAVQNNTTVMQATTTDLNLKNVTICTSYPEAVGYLLALREGLHLPPHLRTAAP